MNSEAFIDICEKSFSESKVRLGPNQKEIYIEKLRRFEGEPLDRMFEKILESVKYFPKIADIYDAARECGYLQTEGDKFKPHHWQPADCNLCRGEGRIAIIWRCFREERPTGLMEIRELTQVFAYTHSFQYAFKSGEYRSIFRCRCTAGDKDTIPKGWPKWSNAAETRVERWV